MISVVVAKEIGMKTMLIKNSGYKKILLYLSMIAILAIGFTGCAKTFQEIEPIMPKKHNDYESMHCTTLQSNFIDTMTKLNFFLDVYTISENSIDEQRASEIFMILFVGFAYPGQASNISSSDEVTIANLKGKAQLLNNLLKQKGCNNENTYQ